jgi:DNA polymerase III subunit delta
MAKGKKQGELAPKDLAERIARGAVDPLYLFLGPERLLRQESIAALAASVDEAFRTFNTDFFSAADTDLRTILDVARQLPMMAQRRLVVVNHADAIKEGAQEALEAYLKAPSAEAVVVFTADALDMRRKTATALSKGCTVVAYDELSPADASRWVEGRARAAGCTIERNALGALVDLVGPDLSRLSVEVEKLTTHAGAGQIGLAAVEALVIRAREHDVWELTDAVTARDRKRSLRVLARQLEAGQEPLALLGMLASTYRKMLLAKELMSRSAPPAEVQAAVKLPPWKAGEFNTHVRRMPVEDITHGLRRIAEVDLAIKSSVGTPRLQIEVLVCELTLPGAGR